MGENATKCMLLDDMNINEVPLSPQQYEEILHIQNTILEMVSSRDESEKILEKLCLMAESLLPNSVASIMFKNHQTGLIDMAYAPSVPQEGIAQFQNLRPGPKGGSCGNAVYSNTPQYVQNTFEDVRWEDLRSIAYDFNLCACWSVPVQNEKKEAIGTFALSSFEHRSPSKFHKILLETAANIVSIVVKNAKNETRITFLAYHDHLTGLYNKTKLLATLETTQQERFAFLHLDINNFNYINTAYGFEFGDRLLRQVAKVLQKRFQNNATAYRINSDEFALVFRANENLVEMIHEIQSFFYLNTFKVDNIAITLSCNYGGAYGKHNLLENASLALRLSKELGKNRYHIFNKEEDILKREDRNKFIRANRLLLDALENDWIVPYFQGIYDNKKKKITKYEALVRIETPQEVLSPYTFLDSASLSGLLPQITKVMIEKSFAVMAKKKENFSINITEDDLGSNYLLAYLQEQTRKWGITPSRVILEILEGVSSSGKKSHLQQLNELKAAGFSLAIDDFGAEYSNFERILDLDIDFLKIDAKYIKNIHKDEKSYEIVRAIAYFAQNSSIICIAEFVHNEAVQAIIEELGIDFSQGYYFSQPEKFTNQNVL